MKNRQGTQLYVGDCNLAENRYFSAISADSNGGFRHFRQGSGTHAAVIGYFDLMTSRDVIHFCFPNLHTQAKHQNSERMSWF